MSAPAQAPDLRERLEAAWYAPRLTLLSASLLPLSWLFGAIAASRRTLYRLGLLRARRIGVPVVVVGNIAVGGTGKTPFVIALAHALAERGRRPGIVSRGYRGAAQGVREVRAGDDAAVVGDEPLLHATSGFPVWIGRDRVAAASALHAAHPQCDVIVSDDGLQHYALARDVEIAVFDGERGLGNRRLLPAGPLREPASRLREVDAVVHRVAGQAPMPALQGVRFATVTRHEPIGLRSLVAPGTPVQPQQWPRGSVHAVAGIGHPQRFFALLSRLGIDAVPHVFPDHHLYVPQDLEFPDAQAIVMTAKDAVKCQRFADARFFALDIRATVDAALADLVLERLDGRQAA